MDKEIKEILVSLNSQCKSAKGCINSYFKIKDIEQLLDYITNLQQENERIEKEYKNKVDEIGKLTGRIYKAIEYIEDNKEKQYGYNYEYGLTDKNINDLLNILQGEEKY